MSGMTSGMTGMTSGMTSGMPPAPGGIVSPMEMTRQKARDLVRIRLNTHFFGGACIRNHTEVCPSGWTLNATGNGCDAEGGYEGPCKQTPVLLTNMSTPEDKMNVSMSCRVEWPCMTCILDFSQCPVDWRRIKKNNSTLVCESTGDYRGYCNHVVDFQNTTDRDKATWATRCDAQWRCKDKIDPPPDSPVRMILAANITNHTSKAGEPTGDASRNKTVA